MRLPRTFPRRERHTRKMATLALAVVLSALALVGGAASAPPRELILQLAVEPPGLDLTATPATVAAAVVFHNLQEALVKVDRTGRLVPWLAERWQTTDHKTYTFALKRGVRFHNGRELRAEDVKYAIERAKDPQTKHPYPRHYDSIQAVTAKDDYTLTFSLARSDPNFLLNLARQGSVIYPKEAVASLKHSPIGTGPYVLEEWVRGDRIVLKKNPSYHVPGPPRLERLVFRFIKDPNAVLAALKAGDVDVTLFGTAPEHVRELTADPRFRVLVGDTTTDVIMAMNNSRRPFTDVRVRRALTHAINRPELLKGALFGFGRVLGSNVDPLNPYFVDLASAVPYDPVRAKTLLAEAGYPHGFHTVLRVSPEYYYTVRTAEIIAADLAKIDVRVRIEQIEWGQWLARVFRDADYDLTIIGHAEPWDIGNYANPQYYFRYDSPRFQSLFRESESTTHDATRRKLYTEMQKLLVEDAPAVFLYMYPRLAASKAGVQGLWRDLPMPTADLSEVHWK